MSGVVGVALIGTGMWGRRLALTIQQTPSLKLVTCFSRDEARRVAFAEEFGCEAAESFEDAINHAEVQGVILATPNNVHAEQAIACAERGKHVFIDKPIADTIADGLAIQQACETAGIILQIGHCMRRLGASRQVKRLIDEGTLGNVMLAEANFSLPGMLTPDKWRFYREKCPGGPLMQLGVHHADTLLYWLGTARRVQGTFGHLVTNAEIDDVGMAMVEFANGTRGMISSSYVSPRTFYLRLFGDEANLHYEVDMTMWGKSVSLDDWTTLTLQTKSGSQPVPFDAKPMLVEELDEVAQCINGKATPETGAKEGLAALEIIQGALGSHLTGQIYEAEQG